MKLRDDQKLATFKCDRAKWDEFLAAATENGTTGASLLKWFVEAYTARKIAPDIDKIPTGLEEKLQELIAPLSAQIEEIERRLGKWRGRWRLWQTTEKQEEMIARFFRQPPPPTTPGGSPKTN